VETRGGINALVFFSAKSDRYKRLSAKVTFRGVSPLSKRKTGKDLGLKGPTIQTSGGKALRRQAGGVAMGNKR